MITFLSLWFLTIFGIAFGFNLSYKFNECKAKDIKANFEIDMQSHWLFNYGYFSALNLDENNLNKVRQIINVREGFIKNSIEDFRKQCDSDMYKNKFLTMLEGYKIYLQAKQSLFDKPQEDLKWVERNKRL